MTEEEKKLQKLAERQDKRIKKMATENQEKSLKIQEQDKQIETLQKTSGLATRIKKKAEKAVGPARVEQALVDGSGSSAAQVLSLGQQALLDYLIDTFPDSFGRHKVVLKSAPPAVAMLWYLLEIISMKKQASLGKKIQMQAANVLGNLGFVYLAQTYWRDRNATQKTVTELAQEKASSDAEKQKLEEELLKARKRLKDAGLG